MTQNQKKTAGDSSSHNWLVPAILGAAAALGATALYVGKRAHDAEEDHPPIGRLMTVDGVRLHYIDKGKGDPLVLIHGTGTMIEDFTTSGLVDRLAERYRVIAFDRPGYGYSMRPDRFWTPKAQARLLLKALARLGIGSATVLGHSWGTLVALALALEPPFVARGLVLASGYYYPTVRSDVPLFSSPAIPVIGDVMRYTVSPLAARLMLPGLIRKMFAPAPVSDSFARAMPKEMMVRPSQIRAASEDAAMMIPAAMDLQHRYRELKGPVVIITGADDRIVDVERQSERLHEEVPRSELIAIPGLGHMIHHLAPDDVVAAIDRAAQRAPADAERPARTEGMSANPA